MGKYKRKVAVINAEQFNVEEWIKTPSKFYMVCHRPVSPLLMDTWYIKSNSGNAFVYDGDWIIRGVDGEYYPCKDELFKELYDEVK